MAPGLNGRQTGTVPKNKARNNGAQSHRSIREALLHSSSLEWEPVLDQNSRSRSHRKISSTYSEAEADSVRYDLTSPLSTAMTSQMRFEDNVSEGNSQDIHGNRMRVNMPDKKQVINKITQIQEYIQQTASLMNTLKTSDCPQKKKQYENLSTILDDLKDSEAKLNAMLKNLESTESRMESINTNTDTEQGDNNNSDSNEEDLIRKTEESKKKLELLQKRKQELIELQEKARKQLQEAQMEQSRLVARASTLNQDISSNRFMDLNVQQLSNRLKATQQLFKTSNQINDCLVDNRESNTEEAEHPDEDQVETSDTETDFQIVSDKVAELNMMKAQLSQIQKIMANITFDSNALDRVSTPTEMADDRRDQGQQQPRSSRNESVDDSGNNAAKLEQAKVKLNQLTQLLELAQCAQGTKGLSSSFIQLTSNPTNDDACSIRRSPSPTYSGKSQLRPSEEAYVETMQSMTREMEERTAAMKEEHEKLVAARQELENLARKIPLAKAERSSLSPDDSGSEALCLTNISLDLNGRLVNVSNEQQSPYSDRSPYVCRGGHVKSRQRGAWNTYVPTTNIGTQDKKCKNEEISRSLHNVNGIPNSSSRDQSRWSPSPTVSFCDNGSCSAIQTQNHLEKSGRIVSEMLQRPMRSEEITVEELYAQHQTLTRTVAQCSHLLWLQQKQIIELRNNLMFQQSAMFQNSLPQSSFPCQSQRNVPFPSNPFQFNSLPTMPIPPLNHPQSMPIQPQEQNYLSPNQSLKLNSGALPNVQTSQDFIDQFYQQGAHTSLPFAVPDMLDYQFRYGNCNRTTAQHVNSNTNVNQNLNQNGASSLNNRIPIGGMTCLGPEDSGALNNQVPPGNRANNYWDNFRSYSRQNLLSHSKSNEDTETARRTSTTSNQERPLREATSSIMNQNNAPAGPSHEPGTPSSSCGVVEVSDYDQSPQGPICSTSRGSQVPISRSRSVESQSHRKNESRNQENDTRNLNPKNESTTRARNPEGGAENLRTVRNDVGQSVRNLDNVNSSRNFVQHVRDLDNDEGRSAINKKKIDKSRSRNEGRGNLNNRANLALPGVLRENVYSEVTNFIRANESRPHFLIQLFRDLQQVTTDSLRQRTLESVQETVNHTERSNINGANLNIIDNRNNMRENRSNLNRNQGDEQSIDNIVCQIRDSQNANRQNTTGSSVTACGGNNLENPNISNIRNFGNPRNNLENEGLRDLRTYFQANLCNFGHNSALENPNLSNIRENLTRRGTATTDLDNANPKNLYLSMYDNAWRRNHDMNSVSDFISPLQSCRHSDQFGNDFSQNDFRGNAQCFCNNQLPPSPAGPRLDMRGDGNFCENRQVPPPQCPALERDNKYVNVAHEGNGEESEADNSFNNDASKRTFMDETTEDATKKNEDGLAEVAGAAALISEDWNGQESRAYMAPSTSRNEMPSSHVDRFSDDFKWTELPQLDNGDLAEADQSRNEEAAVAEVISDFSNVQDPEAEYEDFCSAPRNEVEESVGPRVKQEDGNSYFFYGTGEGSLSDVREAESEGSCLYDNSTSESELMRG